MTIEEKLAQLDAEILAAEDMARRLREERQQWLLAHFAERGIRIGAVVLDAREKRYRVVEVLVDSWTKPTSTPWVKGNPQKADGTWGRTVRHIYRDWTLEK